MSPTATTYLQAHVRITTSTSRSSLESYLSSNQPKPWSLILNYFLFTHRSHNLGIYITFILKNYSDFNQAPNFCHSLQGNTFADTFGIRYTSFTEEIHRLRITNRSWCSRNETCKFLQQDQNFLFTLLNRTTEVRNLKIRISKKARYNFTHLFIQTLGKLLCHIRFQISHVTAIWRYVHIYVAIFSQY